MTNTPAHAAQTPDLKWFYLSFADEGFLGAAVIEAIDTADASRRAWSAGINPGGQMLCIEIEPENLPQFPPEFRNRLLSRDDVIYGLEGKRVGDLSEQERSNAGLDDLHCISCLCSDCAAKGRG